MITQSYLLGNYMYDPVSGVVTHTTDKGRNKVKGKVVGCLTSHGYLQTSIFDTKIRLHRLAWMYMFGDVPDNMQIDHINGNRADNRLCNLRVVSNKINSKNSKMAKNNKSGTTGVCYDKSKDSYIVTVGKKYIGRCKDIDDAIKLRQSSLDNDYTLRHGGKN